MSSACQCIPIRKRNGQNILQMPVQIRSGAPFLSIFQEQVHKKGQVSDYTVDVEHKKGAGMKIDKFRDKYFFLSNFFQTRVKYNGLEFKNNEAAFQAQKVLDVEEQLQFTQLSPKEAKRRGRQVVLRADWEDVKDGIMEEIVRAKFSQHGNLKNKLLATGDAILIEGNTWNDRYWGVDIRTGEGQNRLGKILMKIRKEFQDEENKTLEDIEKKLQMYKDVSAGKEVICPVCGKGTLYEYGPYIKCTNNCCPYLVHFYYKLDSE